MKEMDIGKEKELMEYMALDDHEAHRSLKVCSTVNFSSWFNGRIFSK